MNKSVLLDWNSTQQNNSIDIPVPGGMDNTCTMYEFSVVARNELAIGDPGTVTGGFPIGRCI